MNTGVRPRNGSSCMNSSTAIPLCLPVGFISTTRLPDCTQNSAPICGLQRPHQPMGEAAQPRGPTVVQGQRQALVLQQQSTMPRHGVGQLCGEPTRASRRETRGAPPVPRRRGARCRAVRRRAGARRGNRRSMSAIERPLINATAPPADRWSRSRRRRSSRSSRTPAGDAAKSTSVPSMSKKYAHCGCAAGRPFATRAGAARPALPIVSCARPAPCPTGVRADPSGAAARSSRRPRRRMPAASISMRPAHR